MKTNALALMETASFCAGVRHKRYSGQQEIAPKNNSDRHTEDNDFFVPTQSEAHYFVIFIPQIYFYEFFRK